MTNEFFAILLLLSIYAFAADQNHFISVGTDGLGWRGDSNIL